MKAITYHRYGSPEQLKLKDVEVPQPKENEVLVKVQAAATNPLDWHFLRGTPYFIRFIGGLFKPKYTVLGADVAGVVEAVGKGVEEFKERDEVFGDLSESGFGGFAEYVCIPIKGVAHKPKNLTFEEAAAIPIAGLTALQAVRDWCKVQPNQKENLSKR